MAANGSWRARQYFKEVQTGGRAVESSLRQSHSAGRLVGNVWFVSCLATGRVGVLKERFTFNSAKVLQGMARSSDLSQDVVLSQHRACKALIRGFIVYRRTTEPPAILIQPKRFA